MFLGFISSLPLYGWGQKTKINSPPPALPVFPGHNSILSSSTPLPLLSLKWCRGMGNWRVWSVDNSSSMPLILHPHSFPLLQSSYFPWAAILQDKPAPAWTAAFSREHSPVALHELQWEYLLSSMALSVGCRGICSGIWNISSLSSCLHLSAPLPHINNDKVNLEVKISFFFALFDEAKSKGCLLSFVLEAKVLCSWQKVKVKKRWESGTKAVNTFTK